MERETFIQVVDTLAARGIAVELRGSILYYKGSVEFNTEGYNLLFNLRRLCNILKNELL